MDDVDRTIRERTKRYNVERETLSAYLRADTVREIKARAKRNGVPVGEIVQMALDDFLHQEAPMELKDHGGERERVGVERVMAGA